MLNFKIICEYIMFTDLTLSFFRTSFSGSIANGIICLPEKASLLLEGGNQEFYRLKNVVKKHVTLAGGQIHFEALQVSIDICVTFIADIGNYPDYQIYCVVTVIYIYFCMFNTVPTGM